MDADHHAVRLLTRLVLRPPPMKPSELRELLTDALVTLEASRDELRDLDAVVGDGDLGTTVSVGARAARAGVTKLPPEATCSEVLRAMAREFAADNPSTMSALVSAGTLAAAGEVTEVLELDRSASVRMLTAAVRTIQDHGGAAVGDKTIVDALVPSLAALQAAADVDGLAALASMERAAVTAVRQTAVGRSLRGRAAACGDRSIGHPDAGATAYVRLLQAMSRAWRNTEEKWS